MAEKAQRSMAQPTVQVEAVKADAARIQEAADQGAREAPARVLEARKQSAKLPALTEEAAVAAQAKCTELEALAAQGAKHRQEVAQARERTKETQITMTHALKQVNLEKKMAKRWQPALERAALAPRSEGIITREDPAMVREEKSALDIS